MKIISTTYLNFQQMHVNDNYKYTLPARCLTLIYIRTYTRFYSSRCPTLIVINN